MTARHVYACLWCETKHGALVQALEDCQGHAGATREAMAAMARCPDHMDGKHNWECVHCGQGAGAVRDPMVCDGPGTYSLSYVLGEDLEERGPDRRQAREDRRDGEYECPNCGRTETAAVRGGLDGVGVHVVVCDEERGGCGVMDRRNPELRRSGSDRRAER